MVRQLLRSLAVLVVLAMVSASAAYAGTHKVELVPAHHHSHVENHAASDPHPAGHDHDHSGPCSGDCVGCIGYADLSGETALTVAPITLSSSVSYGDQASTLDGRVIPPDLGPPRPSA